MTDRPRRGTRSYFAAASPDARSQMHWGAAASPHAQTMLSGTRTLAQRARYAARNDPRAAAIVENVVANIVGTGIKPMPSAANDRWKRVSSETFERWTDEADFFGRGDLYALQSLVCRSMVEAGEAFVRLRTRPLGEVSTVPLQLELVDPDLVPADLNRDLASGVRIIGGIELDGDGRRRAYHVYRRHPGDGAIGSLETTRVPAEEMLHVFKPLTAGQVRGVSWLAPVLKRLAELDGFDEATLARARVSSLLTAFVETDGEVGPLDEATDASGDVSLGAGSVVDLAPGERIKFSDPPNFSPEYEQFVRTQLRAIASGVGLTYEQLSGDLSGVNFSSLRAAIVEFRRRVESWQHHVLAFQFCRPVWRRFVELGVASGRLPTPAGFGRNPAPYLTARWLPQAFEWLDPVKDAAGKRDLLAAGLTSRSELAAELGIDVEQLDAEIAADQARADRLGLRFSFDSRTDPDPENEEAGQ